MVENILQNILNHFVNKLELIHFDVCGPMPSTSVSGFEYYVGNQSERRIETLRTDNGGEYTSKEFEAFCKDAGIKRELTTPYNPQQNGVAERKNKIIMEAVKTMIHDQDLPMHIWTEVTRRTVYVQNRLSQSALGFKTPEEMFT